MDVGMEDFVNKGDTFYDIYISTLPKYIKCKPLKLHK